MTNDYTEKEKGLYEWLIQEQSLEKETAGTIIIYRRIWVDSWMYMTTKYLQSKGITCEQQGISLTIKGREIPHEYYTSW